MKIARTKRIHRKMATGLTSEQKEKFDKDGFLVLPGELPQATVEGLIKEIKDLCENVDQTAHPLTKFSTGDVNDEHVGDEYFLGSSDKVRFFLEPKAFNKLTGIMDRPIDQSINKIGHALHVLDPKFQEVTMTKRNLELSKSLGFRDGRILQSMAILKPSEIGGSVPPHQDATFLYTEPNSCIGFWYALQLCTETNGALQAVPGSHKYSPIRQRFVRSSDGSGTTFEPTKDYDAKQQQKLPEDDEYVTLKCNPGDLVLIHGNLLHRSAANSSPESRYAYTFHMIEGETKYDEKNWLQIPPSGGTEFTKISASTIIN